MKISLLKAREDFEDIFCKSLESFLKHKFAWNGTVQSGNTGSQIFIVNEQLNIVYSRHLPRFLLTDLTREYSWAKAWWKRWLQRLYIFLAVRAPFETLLSRGRFSITPSIPELENWVFLPGNHSMRVIDFVNNQCYVFIKKGFSSGFLENDFRIRDSFPSLPVPKVYDPNLDAGYYSEERIIGLPLNRLSRASLAKVALDQAQQAMAGLYLQTKSTVDASEYLTMLIIRLKTSCQCLDDKTSVAVIKMAEKLETIARSNFPTTILLAQSHGDFQDANILKSNDGIYIIDWEYSRMRSIYYDALTYSLSFRFPQALPDTYHQAVQDIQAGKGIISWPIEQSHHNEIKHIHLAILEDLDLKVEELSSLNKNKGTESIDNWLRSVSALNI